MSFPCCLSALIGLSDQDLVQALSLFVNDILENLFVRAAFLFCSCTLMDEHTRCFNFTQTVFTRKQMRSVSQMCQFLPRNPANANVFVPNKYIKSPIWLKRPWMELYWVYKNVLVLFFWITLSLLFLIFSTRHKRGWKQIVFILLMHLYWKWLKSLVWFFAVYFMAVTHFDNSLL